MAVKDRSKLIRTALRIKIMYRIHQQLLLRNWVEYCKFLIHLLFTVPIIFHQSLLFVIVFERIVILSSHINCLYAYFVSFSQYCNLKACFNIASKWPRSSIVCLQSIIAIEELHTCTFCFFRK